MRVSLQEGTVHECTRVTLVGVADYIFLLAYAALGCDFPLKSGRETCAATATETGLLDFLNYLGGSHFSEALSESGIPVAGNGFLNVLRIDETAVAESYTELLLVELHMRGVRNALLGVRCHIKETLNFAALDDVLFDDFLGI